MSELEFKPLGAALLVHVQLPKAESQEDLEELQRLAESAGAVVKDIIVCNRQAPDARTYVGSGKVQEIAAAVAAHEAEVVIFNCPLTPAQERNLAKEFNVEVMDRIALILNIFAQRARTYEGKLQVELASLRYAQARLVRGWTHLERQKGGFGLRGGPGETQIELDRRALRERIAAIKEDLAAVAARREQSRSARRKHALPVISFVGYTNAGKSTLFNKLTASEVFAADLLFATLDPTLRTLELPVIGKAVFADTVGFIRHLPHDLVAAFSSTLEESCQADLLVHVADASDPKLEDNINAVNEVLEQIGANWQPRLMVYNKSDLVEDAHYEIVKDEQGVPVRVSVSAKTGEGLPLLIEAVSAILSLDNACFKVSLGPDAGRLRSLLHAQHAVLSETFTEDGRCVAEVKLRIEDARRIDKQTMGALKQCALDDLPFLDERADTQQDSPNNPITTGSDSLASSYKFDFSFD